VLGATYSVPFAALVAITSATAGACCCFLLSKSTARTSVLSILKFFRGEHLLQALHYSLSLSVSLCPLSASSLNLPAPLPPFQSLNSAIAHNNDDLLFYFTCVRISPLFPNWFINLCAPLTSISLKVFATGSFIGLIPASVLGACVHTLSHSSPLLLSTLHRVLHLSDSRGKSWLYWVQRVLSCTRKYSKSWWLWVRWLCCLRWPR
jgi:uncharacterized membrane protein YdjX (TVP38/TMEM64 family)